MITKYKIFENKKIYPEIGDYVLMKSDMNEYEYGGVTNRQKEIFTKFITNNFGIVKHMNRKKNNINIKYYDIPYTISRFFFENGSIFFAINAIDEFDSDLENLKIKIGAKKYNL